MYLPGDKYHIHYTVGGKTWTNPDGPWDNWFDAKAVRNETFYGPDVQACWITMHNDSLGSRSKVYGHVLKRRVKCTAS